MATSSLSAGEALASTSGKDNYQRLARLIIVGGTTLLRDVFDSIYPPSALPYCLTNPAISSKLSWINKRERQCLYPSPGKCGRSVDFDITMLFKLLKTICNLPTPTGKWVDLPDDSDTSLSADIARIRCYRNCICHDSENMEIRNDQFLSLWANIRDAMIRIAQWLSKGSEWKSAVDKFLKDPLTLDSERHVEELTQWYINDMEHKKALKELKDETSHIKDDTSQIKGDTSQIKGETSHIKDDTSHIKDDTSHIKDDTSHIKDDTSQIKGDTSQISQINVNTVEIKQMLYAVMMNMRVDCESMTYRTSQPNTDESQGPTSSPVSSATTSTCEKKVVLKLIEEAYMRTHDPSDPDEINKFQEFMAELNVIITGTSRGSLVITLRIDSLQILENLWNVYCSGYLGKMVQSCLATDYVLNKLNLRELKLKTTILKEDYEACKRQFTQSSVETVHSPSKAYSSVNSRSSWRALLDPFQKLLERLSQEIEEEQLESLKLLLENHIPAGTLEECKTARNLFKCMKQKGLLGYNNLDFLEELLTEAKRLDLLEIVKEFKLQPAMEIDSGYPATEKVCFSFASQRQNFIVPDTVDALINSMNLVLRVDPRECLFIKCEEVASNWFNLMFELPNRREVVDKLCLNALEKEPWLTQCGVKAVKIGDKSEIHVQAPITGFLPKSIARGDLQSSAQDVSLGVPCKRDDQKLDLIVVVDCATVNSAILGQLKTQLKYMVDYVSRNSAHFRLAIISYQNHPCSGRRVPTASVSNIASVVNFTDDKAKMKEGINSLRCFGISGSRSGLADGLALAVHLSNNNDDDDDDDTYYKCRREAHTVCVLLPLEVQFGTLDIFKCTHGHDVLNLCRQLAGNAVALYVVMRRTSKLVIPPYLPSSGRHIDLMEEFFTGISLMTGGQFIHIKSVKLVSEVISYAVEVDKSMERLFGTAHDIIIDEIAKNDGDVDLEELAVKVQEELTKRSCYVNLIAISGSTTSPSSKLAKKFSLDDSIDSAIKTFQREMQKMRQADLAISSGTPGDANMEEAAGPQVQLLEKQNVTRAVSERMVRRVVVRREQHRPRK